MSRKEVNFKSKLIEWSQKNKMEAVSYTHLDVTLGTLTHSNDVVCMLAGIAAFVVINQAVDQRKTMLKSQENKVVNSHHTLYFPYPMDGQGKFVTQSLSLIHIWGNIHHTLLINS